MADIYGAAPNFSDGQILSASGHLNPLQAYVQALRDDFAGVAMPFSSDFYARVCTFVIRHKHDYLAYRYVIFSGGLAASVQINVGGTWQTVPGSTHTGAGTYDSAGTDISGLGMVVDEFYEIKVEIGYETAAQGRLTVVSMYERPTLYGLAALSPFYDSQVPTAAQWQALSTRAQVLGSYIYAPQPLGQRTWDASSNEDGRAWLAQVLGTLNHRGRYLAYSFQALRSDNRLDDPESPDNGDHWTDCGIKINSISVLRRRTGGASAPGSAAPGEDYLFTDAREQTYTGVLDLNTYPGDLTIGTNYLWEFVTDSVGGDSGGGPGLGGSNANAGLHYLYEIPDEVASLPGWTNFTAWTHGLYVRGDSGTPQVQTLIANLNLLASNLNTQNWASVMDRGVGPAWGLYGIRRWRFLHYRTDPRDNRSNADDENPYDPLPGQNERQITADPVLIYMHKGEEKRVSLTDAYQQWQVVDFESSEGLAPGVPYKLENVKYAIEDITS